MKKEQPLKKRLHKDRAAVATALEKRATFEKKVVQRQNCSSNSS